MPSMKCYQCDKVRACQMVLARTVNAVTGAKEETHIEYLCSSCRRELGYGTKKYLEGRTHEG